MLGGKGRAESREQGDRDGFIIDVSLQRRVTAVSCFHEQHQKQKEVIYFNDKVKTGG